MSFKFLTSLYHLGHWSYRITWYWISAHQLPKARVQNIIKLLWQNCPSHVLVYEKKKNKLFHGWIAMHRCVCFPQKRVKVHVPASCVDNCAGFWISSCIWKLSHGLNISEGQYINVICLYMCVSTLEGVVEIGNSRSIYTTSKSNFILSILKGCSFLQKHPPTSKNVSASV